MRKLWVFLFLRVRAIVKVVTLMAGGTHKLEDSSVATFKCQCKDEFRSACQGLPYYDEDEGKRYCVLHLPSEDKEDDFTAVLENKLTRKDSQDFDFRGTFFPKGTSDFSNFEFDADVSFAGATFCGRVDFTEAKFSGKRADFTGAKFSGRWTSFRNAKFSGGWTSFRSAQSSGGRVSFSGARFSGGRVSFSGVKFKGGRTSFRGATFRQQAGFSGASFSGETNFSGASFNGGRADFSEARFSGRETSFDEAQFSGELTSFDEAQFNSNEGTFFIGARFSGEKMSCIGARFSTEETDFSQATFKEKVTFLAEENTVFDAQSWVWFGHCRIDKPELLTFNTVLLRPGWFINVDVRKVDFTDVKWYGVTDGPEGNLKEELEALNKRGIESRHTLLAQACRRLSANAEENREYTTANEFHYWSLDALRKEAWNRLGLIATLYWASSGYGERPRRAFFVLVGIWFAFTALYLLVDSSPFVSVSVWDFEHLPIQIARDVGFSLVSVALYLGIGFSPLPLLPHWEIGNIGQAAMYSLGALVRLNPKPEPAEASWFQFWVIVEGILGPLQIALFLLAVRRTVMR